MIKIHSITIVWPERLSNMEFSSFKFLFLNVLAKTVLSQNFWHNIQMMARATTFVLELMWPTSTYDQFSMRFQDNWIFWIFFAFRWQEFGIDMLLSIFLGKRVWHALTSTLLLTRIILCTSTIPQSCKYSTILVFSRVFHSKYQYKIYQVTVIKRSFILTLKATLKASDFTSQNVNFQTQEASLD